ncbi:MAG: DNA polymerase I [Fimbriimonadaceae bacterium]
MESRRLVVIDGYSLLYRAFFATRYLSTADGRPTNALYGFVGMLFHLLEHVKPDSIVVALDAPGKTFRHAEYADYKGTRRETQPELKVQLPVAREIVQALGITSLEMTGYEADDIVGTVSRLAEENGYHTTIVTGDLDTLQLIDDCVSVLTMRQGVTETVIYDTAKVQERYGFGPEFVPDYKAIVGDTSDNIPGVPGIGEKGASLLIQQFGTIDGLLENFDKIDPKYQKKIEPVREQMRMSRRLATIDRYVPIEFDFKPFVLTEEQMLRARAVLEAWELRNHLRRLELVLGPYVGGAIKGEAPRAAVVEERIEVASREAKSFEELAAWVGERAYALTLDPGPVQPTMFDEIDRGAYVAIGREVRKTTEALALQLLRGTMPQAILHDAKPLYRQMPECTDCLRFDSMLAGYVLQSGRSQYALRDLISGYLEVQPPTSPEEVAAALHMLEPVMRKRLDLEGQARVLDEIELPLVPILAEMENYGVRVSGDVLGEFSKSLEGTIEDTTTTIYRLAGQDFNIGSPKQLGEVLFEKLGIPGPKKTKTGYATGAEVLQLLAPQHPICQEVLNWRELTKLKSTYADALPRMIGPDGRIHTNYSQTVAATGRLSSTEPNLQNIPIRTELGRQIRKAFIPGEGYSLASFDYSQIELRILADLCGDEALIEAFQSGEDVHTVTAALMYGVENDLVSKEQRRYSKMLNYAVSYGVSEFGLAQQLGGDFSISEAREFIDLYWHRFPKIKAYMDGVVQEARSKGFTTTLFGRRRYFGDIHALNRNERMAAERQAMNAPIQGAAADMIKLAMIRVRKQLPLSRPGGEGVGGRGETRMLLQVHDELVFELATGDEGLIDPIRTEMEQALPLKVPVEVDARVGANWNEMRNISRVEPVLASKE